jgi:hypothetical protein
MSRSSTPPRFFNGHIRKFKLGSVCGRRLANRNVVWMPFSELIGCYFVIDEAEGKKDVSNELLVLRSVANYILESPSIIINNGDLS